MRKGFPPSESYRDIRVVVLGASGFIGRWAARSLCEAGADPHLVVRDEARSKEIFARYGIQGEISVLDLTESRQVVALLSDINPAMVFNLAGYGVDPSETDEETAYSVNAELVEAVCQGMASTRYADWQGQQVIHVGSAGEYGKISGHLEEQCAATPTTLYGRSKLAGTRRLESCCAALSLRGLTARLFTVYGPGEHSGRLLPSLLETARSGEQLALTTGLQQRDFTYVEDVVDGLFRLGVSDSSAGEVVNLATGRPMAVREFALNAAEILGIADGELLFGALPTREEETEHVNVALDRLGRLTGWIPPTKVTDGIRKTTAFHGLSKRW